MEKLKSLAISTFFLLVHGKNADSKAMRRQRRIMAIFFLPHFAMLFYDHKKVRREYLKKTWKFWKKRIVNEAKRLKLMRPDYLHKVIIPMIPPLW